MDLVRPLAMAGVRSWVMARRGQPMRYSRFVEGVLEYVDPWESRGEFTDRLTSFASRQPVPPILYYENDGYMAAISHHRDDLQKAFRFVIGARDLVDDLADKQRFQELARQTGLPTPPSWVIESTNELARVAADLPVIVKPLTRYDRDNGWLVIGGTAKAISLSSMQDVETLARKHEGAPIPLLVQQLVSGPEDRVESYHLYAREPGQVTAAFSGRKIRTWPVEFGHSTALVTTEAPDVEELGRDIVQRLALSGVAKIDFKRDAAGQLHLLEINPRFTLWNHLGALAGVNIPAMIYDDLTGSRESQFAARRSPVARGRAGVTWCDVPKDFRAARAMSLGLREWVRWVAGSDIKTDFAADDPMPFLRGRLLNKASRMLRSLRRHVRIRS